MSSMDAPETGAVEPIPFDPKVAKGFDEVTWSTMDPMIQRAWVDREQSFSANREDQTKRLYDKIEGLETRLSQIQQPKPETGNQRPTLETMGAEDVKALITRHQTLRERALQEPDNEDLQAAASQATPAVMAQLQERLAEIKADEKFSAMDQRLQADRETKSAQAAMQARIMQDFGAQALQPGDPVYQAAEKHLAALREVGGKDDLSTTYAAFAIANAEAKASRGGSSDGRSVTERRALEYQQRHNKVAALQRQGDHAGATDVALDGFLNSMFEE